jgi:hypothetical protein
MDTPYPFSEVGHVPLTRERRCGITILVNPLVSF